MVMSEWVTTTWVDAGMVMVSTVCMYLVVLMCIRVSGLRSLAKMSPTDFVWTVATGSLLASAIVTASPSIARASVAFIMVFAIQRLVSWARRRWAGFDRVVSNCPILLMDGPEVLRANLSRAGVSEDELRSKLREANVLNLQQVRAVVMERTGDISVLHAGDEDVRFDPDLISDVANPEGETG